MPNFIKPCEGRITSPFGWRNHPDGSGKKFHKGIDIAQTGKIPIYAAADGTVTRSGVLSTYGNVVMILHNINGKTYETNYAHLADKSLVVKVGQKVKQGELIAYMGNTGKSYGQHLHFEIHNGRYAVGQPNAVDPLLFVVDEEVLNLQKLLNNHGYKLVVDGITGDVTTNAVKSFQTKNGLVADGIAGTKTIEELMSKAEVKAAFAEKKEEIRMYKPSTNTLEDEMALLLEDAFREGLLKSVEWAKKARTGKLTLDDAAGLQAAILRRKLASLKK